MNTKTVITIKKRTQAGWLMWLLIMIPFFFGTLNDFLGLSNAVRYILDFAWLALFLLMLLNRVPRRMNTMLIWVIVFAIYTLLVYIVQFQSPFYYFWGMRNNFRFYVAFLAFASFLTKEDVDGYIRTFDVLFWINAVVSFVQFFVLGLEQDLLGGIFGAERGCNGYTNIFFVIVVTNSVLLYLEKREKAWHCVAKCLVALLIAALAELKFFFVEFILIMILANFLTKFTWKKVFVVLGGFAAVGVATSLLVMVFPFYEGFLSLDYFLEAGSSDKGYTYSGDLNRLNAISQINEIWLTNLGEQIFGLGLGNCDTSSVEIINTPFFEKYGDVHYSWLSHAFMYLECGWIGLIFYFGFFVLAYFRISNIEKQSQGDLKTYCRISKIVALLCMVISVYNSSLRTEAGYMAYFVLAMPFAAFRCERTPERVGI